MAEEILKAYVDKYGNKPRTPNELLLFAKKTGKNLAYGDAKNLIDGSKSNIKEKSSSQPQYATGDLVLMTKDRHAVIRYIGPVPEMGDNNAYYGVELIDGTVGQSDGIIKGKRYFQTEGQRAMFVPLDKIRRIMTAKDHKRHDSYSKLHSTVVVLKDQYQGNGNGNTGTNENENISPNENGNENANSDDNNNHNAFDILSVVEMDVKNDNKENNEQSIIQSLEQAEEKQEESKQTNNDNNNNSSDAQNPKKNKSRSSIDNINSISKNDGKNEVKRSSQSQIQAQPEKRSSRSGNLEQQQPQQAPQQAAIQQGPQQSNGNVDNTFQFVNYNDTILRYTMQQTNESIQSQLYDLYCNPTTHNILIDAFNEIKNISDYSKQQILWTSLFKRWQKYIQ